MATSEKAGEVVAEPTITAPGPTVDKTETSEDATMDESEEGKRLRATRQRLWSC